MDALNDDMLTRNLAAELALPTSAAEEIERMADLHSRGVATYMKRAAEARKRGKAMVAELEDERRRLKEVHKKDMARIDEEVAVTRAVTADEIAAADKLANISRAALEAAVS